MKTICTYGLTIAAALAMVVSTTAGLSGCQSSARAGTVGEPEFNISKSKDEALAGEIITFTTRSKNLAGRQSEIEWRTTGGELTTEENGRIARVRFDREGTYTVSARLSLDGEVVETDSVSVEISPVRTR